MGATKYEIYSAEAIEIAELFKAFAHPARVMIILELLEAEATNVTISSLLEEIQLSQSSLSKHVERLKHSGILTTKIERVGTRCYQLLGINDDAMKYFKNITLKFLELSQRKRTLIGGYRYISSTPNMKWLMEAGQT